MTDQIKTKQYANLRKHFSELVTHILGKNYYNMGMDVYTCDQECCKDIFRKYASIRRNLAVSIVFNWALFIVVVVLAIT